MPASQRNMLKQHSQVLPLNDEDFFSSEGEREDSFVTAAKPINTGCLSVRGLAEDATCRELHVLFSACPGYTGANLALEERSKRLQGLVHFDSPESAMRAAQLRKGTTWEAGGKGVFLDAVSSDIAQRLLRMALPPDTNMRITGGSSNERILSASNASPSPSYCQEDAPQARPSKSRALSPQRKGNGRNANSRTPPPQRGLNGETMQRRFQRSAYTQQILTKVQAATARGKLDELEHVIQEALQEGVEERDLLEARMVLQERQTALMRHKANHAHSRATARLKEMLIPGPLGVKPWEVEVKSAAAIQALESALKVGKDAASQCAEAGLTSMQITLTKQVKNLMQAWHHNCEEKMDRYMEQCDKRSLCLILGECDKLWGIEQHAEPWALLEAAKRIVDQRTDFHEEEKGTLARKNISNAMATNRAPELRKALAEIRKEVELAPWELNKFNNALVLAEQRVEARWGLIVASINAKTTVLPWDVPPVIDSLRKMICDAQACEMPQRLLEAPVELVSATEKLMHSIERVQAAMNSGNLAELDAALKSAQSLGVAHSPLAKNMFEKASAMLEEGQSKANVKRRLEAAMTAGRKTVMVKALPGVIQEAEAAGFRASVVDEAKSHLSKATAQKKLEEAIASKDSWSLKNAIDEGRRNNVSQALLNDASSILEEIECKSTLTFAIERGDPQAIKNAMKTWQRKGFDAGVLQNARTNLERIEARSRALKVELDQALSSGVNFEELSPKITVEGMRTVKVIADNLNTYSELAVQIDVHFVIKNRSIWPGAQRRRSRTLPFSRSHTPPLGPERPSR